MHGTDGVGRKTFMADLYSAWRVKDIREYCISRRMRDGLQLESGDTECMDRNCVGEEK